MASQDPSGRPPRSMSVSALAAAPDGSLWVGYKSGALERYSEAGRLLWRTDALKPGIGSLAALGSQLWVGTLDGRMRVLDHACALDNEDKVWCRLCMRGMGGCLHCRCNGSALHLRHPQWSCLCLPPFDLPYIVGFTVKY